jgi:hypothetical protein
MPPTFTTNLGLHKPATGEEAGTWGDSANRDFDFIDNATDGMLSILLSASTYNLNTQQDVASEGRNKHIIWTGTLTQATTVTIMPNTAQKLYVMRNATNQTVIFQQGSGSVYSLAAGHTAIITCDGAGSGASVHGAMYDPEFGNVLIDAAGQFISNAPATFTGAVTFSGSNTFSQPQTMATLSVGQLTITGGPSSATGDVYFRGSSGALQSLAIGAVGQVLRVASATSMAWATVGMSIGDTIANSIASAPYIANASVVVSQDVNFRWTTTGLGIGLLPAHTLHVGSALNPEIWLDTSNYSIGNPALVYANNALHRWTAWVQDAETGTNSGSNYYLLRYNDAGTSLGTVICCTRATGDTTIGASGDYTATLAVIANNPANSALRVRGAVGQTGYLQLWENNAGQRMASIDNTGKLFLAGSTFLSLDQYGALDLWPTVPGWPWGTIHIGPEQSVAVRQAGVRGSIAMEAAGGANDSLPLGIMRIYFRQQKFIIQYADPSGSGQQWFAYINLIPNGNAVWGITATAL